MKEQIQSFAELYEVKTQALKQTVRSNITRFPKEFVFGMNQEDQQGLGYMPFCFSEQEYPYGWCSQPTIYLFDRGDN